MNTDATHTVWRLIAHHDDREKAIQEIRQHGRIALGWGRIGNAARYRSAEEVRDAILIHPEYPTLRNSTCGGKALWHLQHTMRKGDFVIIVGPRGRELVVEVTSPYHYQQTDPLLAGGDYYHQRNVTMTALDADALWQAAGGREPGNSPYCALVRCARPITFNNGESK